MSKGFKFFLVFFFFAVLAISFFLIRFRVSSVPGNESFIGELATKYCAMRGGEEREIGCGIAGCSYKCSLPF